MTCEQFRKLVLEFSPLSATESQRDQFSRHIGQCQDCQQHMTRTIDQRMSEMPLDEQLLTLLLTFLNLPAAIDQAERDQRRRTAERN